MNDPKRPAIAPAVCYCDPKAALVWLEQAFGFEQSLVVVNDDGSLGHSEMRFGDGLIMVGGEFDERHKSSKSLGSVNTHSIHVQLESGLDAHCERARAAGAVITREPADQFYGDRVYAAIDPEGHVWSFGQTFKDMSLEDMTTATGASVRRRL